MGEIRPRIWGKSHPSPEHVRPDETPKQSSAYHLNKRCLILQCADRPRSGPGRADPRQKHGPERPNRYADHTFNFALPVAKFRESAVPFALAPTDVRYQLYLVCTLHIFPQMQTATGLFSVSKVRRSKPVGISPHVHMHMHMHMHMSHVHVHLNVASLCM